MTSMSSTNSSSCSAPPWRRRKARDGDLVVQAVQDRLTSCANVVDIPIQLEIQPSACDGGLMLSPVEVNTMIGEVTLRTSNVTPSCECNWLRVNLSPMKRLSTRYCSSSPFS